MSPGKAAATAATAAAKEAARAAAASVRAAEAAADAAEAAEAAAEAEEEMCSHSPGGGGFRSPPAVSEFRERHSPARSAFSPAEGGEEEAGEHQKGSSPRRKADPSTSRQGRQEGGEIGDRGASKERVRRREQDDESGGKQKDYCPPAATGRGSSEEEMLRKARDQVGAWCFKKSGRTSG